MRALSARTFPNVKVSPLDTQRAYDVAVVGAGPAGLVTGLCCAAAGLRTSVLGPAADRHDARTAALLDGSVSLLKELGVWSAVEPRVARAEDVRAALLYVSRKEAPYGIVYQTDAAADKGVRVAGVFPPDTYPPIIYPIALTAASKNPEAAKFLAYLRSDGAKPFFTKQGFSVLTCR